MARVCHRCTSTTAVIRCVTETQNLCLTCDYLRHREGDAAGHIRYQICDECMINPALLLCSDHMMVLCQSCYSHDYNCVAYGHHTQIINRFPRQDHNNKNKNKKYQHNHDDDHEQHQVGDNERRKGMFEMSCKGNNNCEGGMSAMDCESCLVSNAVIYCPQHNKLLCDDCDRMIHLPEAVLPHLRCQLCVTCKRLSRTFLVKTSYFILPPIPPAAAAASD